MGLSKDYELGFSKRWPRLWPSLMLRGRSIDGRRPESTIYFIGSLNVVDIVIELRVRFGDLEVTVVENSPGVFENTLLFFLMIIYLDLFL